ncbi:MAG: RibD family protein [Micropepsaceae bacterium]
MSDLFSAELPSSAGDVWNRLLGGESISEASDPLDSEFLSLYGPLANPGKTPFVIAQLGQSLDGYIATQSGASHYVTGPESLIHLHRLRALCDAVVVGWRTVEADNPQLNIRHVDGEDPLRVIVDIEGKLPASHRAFSMQEPGALRLTGEGVPALGDVKSEVIDVADGRADPKAVIDLLAERGCKKILMEGGGALVSSFLNAHVLDRLHLAIAPLLLGEGKRGIATPAAPSLDEALRLQGRQYKMGNDVLFDFDLR